MGTVVAADRSAAHAKALGRRRVLRLTCADLSARQDDLRGETLEQVEAGDASEQNER